VIEKTPIFLWKMEPFSYAKVHLNRQPTTDNRQPTTDNRQPTTDNRQSTTDNRQPTTDNRQPTTDNRQPTTDNRQPTTDNRQPTTDYLSTSFRFSIFLFLRNPLISSKCSFTRLLPNSNTLVTKPSKKSLS